MNERAEREEVDIAEEAAVEADTPGEEAEDAERAEELMEREAEAAEDRAVHAGDDTDEV